jgi:hypothetical protein
MGNVTDFETGTAKPAVFHNVVLCQEISVPGKMFGGGLTSISPSPVFRLN